MTGTATGDIPSLKAGYAHCIKITRARARNFYLAFFTLPPASRRAICALYAYGRLLDDVADGELSHDAKKRSLSDIRDELPKALAHQSTSPLFVALAHAIDKFNIPVSILLEIADGVEQDLYVRRYETFSDLRQYCYLVASTVGLSSLEIFGYRSMEARQAAVDLGIAMQLTNIVRDVAEDASRNRIYIPLEDLRSFGVDEEELLAHRLSPRVTDLLAFQVQRAKHYYDKAQSLFKLLPRLSRPCPMVLFGVYRAILQQIEHNRFDVFSKRASLGTRRRAQIALNLWIRGLLWTPPKL